jgi:hypothetical protein
LLASHGDKPVVRESAVLELLRVVRDNLNWPDVVAYVDRLPPRLQRHPLVIEQRLLAQAKQGDPAGAVGALTRLIKRLGATSERQGLLGGRYKQLMRQAEDDAERQRFLDLAIDAYAYGMTLDLNDYYPTSNLPRLYRQRGRDGDEERAVHAITVTVAACSRSVALGNDDVWTRATLLGAAFDTGDVEEARKLFAILRKEGAAEWQHETALQDLELSQDLHPDAEVRRGLDDVVTSLRQLVGMPR